jgi:hypothetical protein
MHVRGKEHRWPERYVHTVPCRTASSHNDLPATQLVQWHLADGAPVDPCLKISRAYLRRWGIDCESAVPAALMHVLTSIAHILTCWFSEARTVLEHNHHAATREGEGQNPTRS